jgi:hypothetical protein
MAKKLTRAEIEAQRARAAANTERMAELLDAALSDLERRHGNPARPPGLSDAEWVSRLADSERAGRSR